MKGIAKLLLCLTILVSMFCSISAQNAAKNWLFGNHAWIDFNISPPATPDLPPSSTFAAARGSSSISDSNGNLLFYTNGASVWNRDHNIMPHGTGLLGATASTQSALIVPCTCNKYFIFTTDSAPYTRGLNYSVVDMTAAGGMGDITALKNIQLVTPVAEKIAAVKDGNGGLWVVAHDVRINAANQRGDRFFAYHILPGADCTVNTKAVISLIGSTYIYVNATNNKYSPGQMKISPDGKLLAVAGLDNVTSSNSSFIELFKFNTTTGMVSDFGGSVPKVIISKRTYGIEFSPNSRYLYAGTHAANTNQLYRFDTTGNTLFLDWTYNVGNNRQIPGSFQLAPDGKIYIAVNGFPLLRVIDNPDVLAAPNINANINVGTFTLPSGSGSNYGLPGMVAGDFACTNTGLPGGGCACDQVTQTPFLSDDLSIAWKAFSIYNVKFPGSDIKSVDIDISDSNGQPPPQGLWSGGGLRVNGAALPVPDWWRSPYTRIPNGTIYNTAIAAHPDYSLPAVNFNLGLDRSRPFTGTVKLKFTHVDGSTCQWTSDDWTPGPPPQLTMRISERYLGDLQSEFLPLALEFFGGVNIKSNAKWIAVEPLDADTEVFSLDGGGETENEDTAGRPQLVIGSARKQEKAALYQLARPVNLEQLTGGEVKLVLKRPAGNPAKPRLRFIFFDENANIIGFVTNEDSK